VVLVFHGNAGDRSHRAPLAAALARRGWSVLLLDYRGYGGNPGTPTEDGLIADARAARAFVASRGLERAVYFGESLGAAVAVALAVEAPPRALILRSPFTSLADMAREHYPWLPPFVPLLDRYPSLERMPHVRCPVMVVVGDQDSIVPVEQSQRLFAAAADPKALVTIPGADHNDLELLAGPEMMQAIAVFLDQHA
jgi:fermentation-respiration switch protein FrsA (DUF1100 family)